MIGSGVRWLLIVVLVAACSRVEKPFVEEVSISLLPQGVHTRSGDPDDNLISDYNILVYNSFGLLEASAYVSRREYRGEIPSLTARLLKDSPYMVFAAANLGYELKFGSYQEALEYRFHLAYPDEFEAGIPMAAYLEDAVAGADGKIEVPLERLMARVDLRVDRRSLDEDVSLRITSARVCNSPSSVLLFGGSTVEYWDSLFDEGYLKTGSGIYPLNHDTLDGMSGTVKLYHLENLSGGIAQSYIEVKADYFSSTCHTRPGESLIFRFHVSDNRDACRNTCYPIILKPSATGLDCPQGWRLDKSALVYD